MRKDRHEVSNIRVSRWTERIASLQRSFDPSAHAAGTDLVANDPDAGKAINYKGDMFRGPRGAHAFADQTNARDAG